MFFINEEVGEESGEEPRPGEACAPSLLILTLELLVCRQPNSSNPGARSKVRGNIKRSNALM